MDPSLCQLQSKSAANSHFHTHFHGRASQFNGSNINSLTHSRTQSLTNPLIHSSLTNSPIHKITYTYCICAKTNGMNFHGKIIFSRLNLCVCLFVCVNHVYLCLFIFSDRTKS